MANAHGVAAHDHPHDDHHTPTGWRRYLYSTNHKDIGTMYLVFAIFAALIGATFSVVMTWWSMDHSTAGAFFPQPTSST